MKTKKCTKCGVEFEANAEFFHRDSRNKATGLVARCKICVSENSSKCYRANPDIFLKRNQKWRRANPDFFKNYKRPESYRVNKNRWYREKYKKDFLFKTSVLMKRGIWGCLNGRTKRFSGIEYLGCSFEQLKTHLEKQFVDGMTWENHGEWHIDHIKPLCSFDFSDERELFKAWHFSNLQPLWAKDNISKGGKFPLGDE